MTWQPDQLLQCSRPVPSDSEHCQSQIFFYFSFYHRKNRFTHFLKLLICPPESTAYYSPLPIHLLYNNKVKIKIILKLRTIPGFRLKYTVAITCFYLQNPFLGSEIGGYKIGKLIIEGKTKQVFELPEHPTEVLILSKDRITAGDGAKAHDLEGKAEISNQTNGKIFEILNSVGEYL